MLKILDHFKKSDSQLHAYALAINWHRELKADKPENYFYRLCYDIVGQQLSGRVAEVIFERFVCLFPGKKVTPAKLLAMDHELLRSAGLSNAKAKYLRHLAEAVEKELLAFKHYGEMTDEEIIANLIQVKGIGRWTAEMFLMFTLGREDVFSYGDLGLKNGLKKIYGIEDFSDREKIEAIVEKWKPYRTYACLILWASLEN